MDQGIKCHLPTNPIWFFNLTSVLLITCKLILTYKMMCSIVFPYHVNCGPPEKHQCRCKSTVVVA